MTSIALRILKYTERTLSSVHRSALKTISMLSWAMWMVQEPNLSEWARRLPLFGKEPTGQKKPQEFKTKKFRIWRFLARSVWGAKEVWKSITQQWLDPRDLPEVRGPIQVTMDWTKMGKGFWALVIALPYHGRAIPLSVGVIREEFLENVMTDLEIDLVREFLGWLSPALRSRIVILADRGFAKTELFEAIEEAGAYYVIRLHRDAHVRMAQADWIEVRDLPLEPGEGRSYSNVIYTKEHEKVLHVAMRRLPVGKANDPNDDTWFLATNCQEPGLAPGWYAKRFKIEELFKDWKSMLDVAKHRFREEEGVDRLLAIVGLYTSFVILEGQASTTPDCLKRVTQMRNGKPELGIFRQAQAILHLWAFEAVGPDLQFFMQFWTQDHTPGRRRKNRTVA